MFFYLQNLELNLADLREENKPWEFKFSFQNLVMILLMIKTNGDFSAVILWLTNKWVTYNYLFKVEKRNGSQNERITMLTKKKKWRVGKKSSFVDHR